MKIKTIQFGEVEFSEDMIIHFKEGVIGFETYTRYILMKGEDELFYWLASIDEPELIFPLFPIRLLEEDYPEVKEHEAFAIVKMDKDPLKITVNLKAPIYYNQESKKGFQKILDIDQYPVAYKLFVESN